MNRLTLLLALALIAAGSAQAATPKAHASSGSGTGATPLIRVVGRAGPQTTTTTPTSVTARRGNVSATYSWVPNGDSFERSLQVTRGGRVVYRASADTHLCKGCGGLINGPRGRGLQIVNLDADAEPEIVVQQYEGGGGPCCNTMIVLDWTPRGYVRTNRNYGTAYTGVSLVDPGGKGIFRIRHAYARFAYAYTCGACMTGPIVIDGYDSRTHKLVDVTWQYRSFVAAEAATYKQKLVSALRAGQTSLRGLAIPWYVDALRLGNGLAARKTLDQLAQTGVLDDAVMDPESGTAFVAKFTADVGLAGFRPFPRS